MVEDSQADHARRLQRISRVSGVMKWVMTIFMVLVFFVGILALLALIAPEMMDILDDPIEFGSVERTFAEVPFVQRLAMAVFTDVMIATFMIVLFFMRRMFVGFQRKDFFSTQTLSALVQSGVWFMIFGIFDFLEDPVHSMLATLDMEKGQRALEISFEGSEMFFLIFGMMFITLGWVLREAARMHEENQQFI